MKIYRVILGAVAGALVLLFSGCGAEPTAPTAAVEESAMPQFEDGRYRGIYGDRGDQQVSIQFHLVDGVLQDISFRHLYHSGIDYRQLEEGAIEYPVWLQHQQVVTYLEGRPVDTIADLKSPGGFVDDIDGYSGATIRGAKIYSAIRDGLNRGLYAPSGELNREIGSYPDGRFRGIYGDRGEQQVAVQFELEGNTIRNVEYRQLYHSGNNYRTMSDDNPMYPVLIQHRQIASHLEGKPLSAIFDLFAPGGFVDDIDGYSGATVRGAKLFSAFRDGLNRGLYTPAGDVSREIGSYPDGRYRGIYGDRSEQQVSVQFNLSNNTIRDVSFRHLFYNGNDFRNMDNDDPLYPVVQQHEQIVQYLEGKPLSAMFDLYTPGSFIDDIDGYSGATVRGNKVLSAMMDGLNRGLY